MKEKLAPLDVNFWSLDSETTPQVIATYCVLDRHPAISDVQRAVEEQLEIFTRLKERVIWEKGWRWEKYAAFDLSTHVHHRIFPNLTNQAELNRAAEIIFSAPLRHDISPWEFVVFTGARPESPAAVMFRVHHALADGLGGFEFFHRVCNIEPISQKKDRLSSGGAASGKTVKAPPRFGLHFWRSIRRLFLETHEGKRHSLANGTNSSRRELQYIDIPLSELRAVRKRIGASVNDILLSLVSGALRQYQLGLKAAPENVKALIPFSLRGRAKALTLGNHITGVALELPVALGHPLERVMFVKAAMNRLKMDGSFGAFRILGLLNGHLPDRLRKLVGQKAARRTNLICTNMPGPERPLYLADAKIIANYGCAALLYDQGIAFSFISYAGQMHVSFISDPAIIPNSEQFMTYFVETWDELRANPPEQNAYSTAAAQA